MSFLKGLQIAGSCYIQCLSSDWQLDSPSVPSLLWLTLLLGSSASLGAPTPTQCFPFKRIWMHFHRVLMSTMENTDLASACGRSAVHFQVNLLIVYSGQAFSILDSWLHLHESDITSCVLLTAEDVNQAHANLGKHSCCFCRTAQSPASLPTWGGLFSTKKIQKNWPKKISWN